MIPTIFHLGPIPFHSFGLMMMLAFIGAWRMLSIEMLQSGRQVELAERMIFWAAVGGLVGARVGYIVSFPNDMAEHPLATIFGTAGLVYYWGFFGGALGVWILLRKVKENFLSLADLSGPALAVGYAIGRLGCQLSGDGDYGRVSDLPWAMGYPLGVVPTPVGVTVHPTPMYETFMALGIAFVLRSPRVREILSGRGQLFGLYLALSALARFLVEFVRVEPVVISVLTQAQVESLVLLPLALGLIFVKRENVPVKVQVSS